MGSKEKKKENGNESKSIKGWIALLVPCLFAFAGEVYKGQIDVKIQKMEEEHEERMHGIQNEQEQSFYCSSEIVNKFGIEYKQYEIISKPTIEGYHVLVYPYIVSGKEMDNRVYVPVMGVFTSNEYRADIEGRCKILKDMDEDLEGTENNAEDFSEVKVLLAIQYAENGTTRERKVYDIGDGQLVESDKELVIGVLKAWESEENEKGVASQYQE